jgi:hypothetical protein
LFAAAAINGTNAAISIAIRGANLHCRLTPVRLVRVTQTFGSIVTAIFGLGHKHMGKYEACPILIRHDL